MAKKDNVTNIKKRRHRFRPDIGIVIFGLVFLYLAANIVIYLTGSHIRVYEVQKGSIITDNAYTGFAVRTEEITYASSTGYVTYLLNEGEKAAVGSDVCYISREQTEEDESAGGELSTDELNDLIQDTQKFNLSYDAVNFKQVYSFSYDCQSAILDSTESGMQDAASKTVLGSAKRTTADVDGIISYTVDGYEDITAQSFTASCLDRSDYAKQDVRNRRKTEEGDPLYKTITDDTWYLFFSVSDDTADVLKDMESVSVRFKKDNAYVDGDVKLTTEDGKNILRLTFGNSVMRYANDRYLDIELILDNQSGLKIPKTAVTEKAFYAVPNAYITKGGNSNSDGVYVRTKDGNGYSSVFTPIEIYTSDDSNSYVPTTTFEDGTVLLKPESTDTYELSKTKKLKGVYNVNRGYAVFRLITVLSESDTYEIVEENDAYGLSLYDQIVLDGSSVEEDQIVYQ